MPLRLGAFRHGLQPAQSLGPGLADRAGGHRSAGGFYVQPVFGGFEVNFNQQGERRMKLPQKENYRIDEVAVLFGVARSTVYRWADEGKIAFKKTPGGGIRIPREEIMKTEEKDD